MAVFTITTNNDSSYDKIMEYLIEKSIMFSKDASSGPIKLEIHGNSNDYTYFQNQIKSGVLSAHLQEML